MHIARMIIMANTTISIIDDEYPSFVFWLDSNYVTYPTLVTLILDSVDATMTVGY